MWLTDRVTYMDNLKGCHVELLNRIKSKFNGKNKLMLTSVA
jgi:hypothetical protein